MLLSMGPQRVGHNLANEQQQQNLSSCIRQLFLRYGIKHVIHKRKKLMESRISKVFIKKMKIQATEWKEILKIIHLTKVLDLE